MKKSLTLFLSAFLSVSLLAQISFSSADMPTAPWEQHAAKNSNSPSVNFGIKGANQFYNFSNLIAQSYDTALYKVPTSGQASTFGGATIAATLDNTNYIYFKTQPTAFQIMGIEGILISGGNTIQAPYSNPADVFRFPTVYGTTFRDTSVVNKTVPGSDVGQPVYEVRLTATTISTDTVDGWGRITTPVGTYKCLRKQRKDVTTTLIEYRLCSTSIICPWITLAGFPTTTTTVRYSYPTKETKGTSVVSFEYDSLNNVTAASYSLIPPFAPEANFGYASGGGGLVFFTDSTDGYPDSYSWDFGDGSTSTSQNPNHTYSANGAYYVCLTVTNAGGSNTYCDTVHVTAVSANNNAPVAITDTISLLQATSIAVYHVADNDIDPEGDNICMDLVWGSPYVEEVIGGTCDMVSITPDTLFLGTDTAYYRICDNGTPVLCDTGLIIFTVIANPALYPVANDDAATVTQPNGTVVDVVANDVAPSGNGLSITNITTTSTYFSIVSNTEIEFAPDSLFTGNDTVLYVVCDNGFPAVWCDSAILVITSAPNSALLPVASFTTDNPTIFNCGASVSADSTFTIVNTSTNFDTVYWYISAAGGTCNDSVVDFFWSDTASITPAQYAAQWGCADFDTLEVCMFVSNQYGWDAVCEIVCNITWATVGIRETSLSNISMYPNPANNLLTINMGNNNYTSIEIYNTLGEKVKTISGNITVVNIPVSELASGVYIATVVDFNNVRKTVGRFVKE